MSEQNKKAVYRIINSVWTLEFEQVSDTHIKIIRFSREDEEGYEREDALPRCNLIETSDRTVVGAYIGGRQYAVNNPKHVFSYDGDVPITR